MTSGHVACAGCGASLSMRLAMKGLGKPKELVIPACCWTIIPGPWPQTAMEVPFFHAAFPQDMIAKFKKARSIKGMRFIHLLSACPPGGRIPENMSIELMRLAVLPYIFPLYELENGEIYRQTVIPDNIIPVERYLRLQGRFKHLTETDIQLYKDQVTAKFEPLREKFQSGF